MAVFDFPNNPAVGDKASNGSVTYIWDGVKWVNGVCGSATPPVTPAPPVSSIQFNNNGAFGGSANLIWDNTNNRVGVLTTSPKAALDIAGNAFIEGSGATINSGAGIQLTYQFGNGYIYARDYGASAYQPLYFMASNIIAWPTGVFQIPGGYLSVGAMNYSGVAGDICVGDPNSPSQASGRIRFGVGTTASIFFNGTSWVFTPALPFTSSQWINGASGAIYYNGGNVGIGTASPRGNLEVVCQTAVVDSPTGMRGLVSSQYFDGAHSACLWLVKGRGTISAPTPVQVGDFSGHILWEAVTVGGTLVNAANINSVITGVGTGNLSADMLFCTTNAGASATEHMRITAAGNVGIGTANPQGALDVVGGGGIVYSDSASNHDSGIIYTISRDGPTGYLRFWGGQVGYTGYFFDTTNSSSSTDRRVLIYNSGPNISLGATLNTIKLAIWDNGAGTYYGIGVQSGYLTFGANITESGAPHMIIRNDGHVGIGTTAPAFALDVNGPVNIGTGSYCVTGVAGAWGSWAVTTPGGTKSFNFSGGILLSVT